MTGGALTGATRRTGALVVFRLRGALSVRSLAAPGLTLVGLELLGLAGGAQAAAVLMVTSVFLALPVLAWASRQVLDAEPDDQALLSRLAVGGAGRDAVAGLVAAAVVAVPLAVLTAWASLLKVDARGVPLDALLLGSALAVGTGLAGVAIGAFAARTVAGRGTAPVAVLVAVPVLVAVLGLSGSAAVRALVPRLDDAVRAGLRPPVPLDENQSFVRVAPGVVAQVLAWDAVVLGLRLVLARRAR